MVPAMRIPSLPAAYSRKIILTTPALCTAAAAGCAMFFRTAPAALHTQTIQGITGGVLAGLSVLSFVAVCKVAAEG